MYYQGNWEIQSDGVQTLYLMNPNYDSSMVMMNSHAPPLPQLVGVPLSHDPRQLQGIEAAIPRFQYNTWAAALPDQTPGGLSLTLSARQADFPAPPSEATTMRSVLIGSKYLKAAQELLDEVAIVGRDRKIDRPAPSKIIGDNIVTVNGESGGKIGGDDQLTTPQRQEILMKKAKLNTMFDEVEQRHRQYQNQMQVVIGSFEQAAGSGSARIYTQLALKTILKQFKCLKSTISAQIKGLNRSLGEEESTEKKAKVVDYEVRQQMQQLGMMQNNAWKPQRGLPERAVSVLRAWLFEHFLHPYPKDSDKEMLAKQTGLTRSQVSNWFINARVRLWKPMVEEMYQEEIKNQHQINSTEAGSDRELPSNSIPRQQNNTKTATMDPPPTTESSFQSRTGFAQIITSFNIDKHLKKPPNVIQDNSSNTVLSCETEIKDREKNIEFNNIKFSPDPAQITKENYLSMAATNINSYGIGELNADQQLAAAAGFQGNNFSLTLGLPPAESLSHQDFEFGTRIGDTDRINQAGASHPSIAYEIIDFQNRKPHPVQLLQVGSSPAFGSR